MPGKSQQKIWQFCFNHDMISYPGNGMLQAHVNSAHAISHSAAVKFAKDHFQGFVITWDAQKCQVFTENKSKSIHQYSKPKVIAAGARHLMEP